MKEQSRKEAVGKQACQMLAYLTPTKKMLTAKSVKILEGGVSLPWNTISNNTITFMKYNAKSLYTLSSLYGSFN